MALRRFEAPGVKGFVQEETQGFFNTVWTVYENKFIGNEKIGSVEPKEDELRKFLEDKYGKPVKIWWDFGCFPQSLFYIKFLSSLIFFTVLKSTILKSFASFSLFLWNLVLFIFPESDISHIKTLFVSIILFS